MKQAGGSQQPSGSDFVTLPPELNLRTASSLLEQGDVPHHLPTHTDDGEQPLNTDSTPH